MNQINLGTSSWNFSDWKGVFYPQSISSNQMLRFYAEKFVTVEVNTSFYALPKPTTLVNWLESVPPGFSFCLKAPRAITHEKRLRDCRSETLAYLDALRSLGPAAAPALLQLPPSLTRAKDGQTLANYLTWLAGELGDLRLGVEVRSRDLMTEAFAKFLAEHGMALVLVDREGTPDLFPIWASIVESENAPSFCLIRWIGDDKNGPTGNRELSNLRDGDLSKWADRIQQLSEAGCEVFGYMHNPYEGHSPASVNRLIDRLDGRVAMDAWPPEDWVGEDASAKEGNQLSLFGDE